MFSFFVFLLAKASAFFFWKRRITPAIAGKKKLEIRKKRWEIAVANTLL